MGNIQKSAFLQVLIEAAKKVGEDAGNVVTAEKLIVATITAIENPKDFRLNRVEEEILRQIFARYNIDISRAKKELKDYIQNTKSLWGDERYYKVIERVAEKKASEKEDPCVTVELLLECIMNDPSVPIKAQIDGSRKKETEAPTKKEEAEAPDIYFDEEQSDESMDIDVVFELTRKVKEIGKKLSDTVLGQEKAVSVFMEGYFRGELIALTDKNRKRPRSIFLFAGPPGVGKTFLAEQAAELLDLPFARFDMSEYSDEESVIEFSGSDKVYKNGKKGNFTSFVEENPKSVVLFDEIEKAHIVIIHQFLQMLDAGRARDNFTDTQISLKDVIMIFTTNAGKQLYEEAECGNFSDISRKVILDALRTDVNPQTQVPYFPAAICSRFASGNVLMFNHVEAYHLREIAKREVLRHAENFEKTFAVDVNIDKNVYTTLLLAEGGKADARVVRASSERFFDEEVFELFRLMGTDAGGKRISNIRVDLQLPEDPEVRSLFRNEEKQNVLLFSDAGAALCRGTSDDAQVLCTGSPEEAKKLLQEKEISLIVLDIGCGIQSRNQYLNIEDIDSKARTFLGDIRQKHPEMPIYMLLMPGCQITKEERDSFLNRGVRGFIESDGTEYGFLAEVNKLCENIHQQHAIQTLAKSNQMVTYETAQSLLPDGKTAQIRLFDLKLATAINAEDSDSILSGISKPDVRMEDVIGAEDAKKEIRLFGDILKNPKKYRGLGVRAPKGILLYGPPGTGKTMLAKAMASEMNVTFIAAEGNQFVKKYIGEGAEAVHELFKTARKYAPTILFIDEIDAIAKERTGEEKTSDVLTAFLTEMDGFKNNPSKPVFVLAATNFEVEPGSAKSLDEALLRRFDRRIYVDLPNREERARYIRLLLSKKPIFQISDAMVENLALRSTGRSLANLESVFDLALRNAITENEATVSDSILEEAYEIFCSGEKREWDEAELHNTAVHEAGHAMICHLTGETPSYLTIVARGKFGGYMQHGDTEKKGTFTKEELLGRIRTSLGGRAAELVYFGEQKGLTTGASGDLITASRLARQIICNYGMSKEFGLAVVDEQEGIELAGEIRRLVNEILQEELQKAISLIVANRVKMERLVNELIQKNRLNELEISEILNG